MARVASGRDDLELVAINDPAPAAALAPALARDSVFGRFAQPVEVDGEGLRIAGRRVEVLHGANPAAIAWSGARVVVEASGRFTQRADAALHLGNGVEQVIVSANSADADITVCLGVNDHLLDANQHRVISNSSCTTNCIAPVAAVLHRQVGITHGLMTTVHAYTAGQELVDSVRPGADARYGRAAAVNLIPAATGAARAVALVVPELEGRLDGQAVRVPVANGSMVELVAQLERSTDRAELEDLFRNAANRGRLAGLLGVTDEAWVSSDVLGDARSAIVDLGLLQVIGTRMVRVVAWYDNEWGYANRLADLLARLGR